MELAIRILLMLATLAAVFIGYVAVELAFAKDIEKEGQPYPVPPSQKRIMEFFGGVMFAAAILLFILAVNL